MDIGIRRYALWAMLVGLLVLMLVGSASANPMGGTISGTVTLPTGLTYPLPDETLVKLYEPGGRLHVLDQARNAIWWRRQLALDTRRLAC